jgi:hypothetical protein
MEYQTIVKEDFSKKNYIKYIYSDFINENPIVTTVLKLEISFLVCCLTTSLQKSLQNMLNISSSRMLELAFEV